MNTVIKLILQPGVNHYDTKLGLPQAIVPGSFKPVGTRFQLYMVVDKNEEAAPCSFTVVGLNVGAEGHYIETTGNSFLFSTCFAR